MSALVDEVSCQAYLSVLAKKEHIASLAIATVLTMLRLPRFPRLKVTARYRRPSLNTLFKAVLLVVFFWVDN